ncbi:uncharacterized protein Z519_02850 [Cladophialophora bantiana CBS 173.52]|uniref:Enoyl reductase (ER) domain-containing protein n=1 Tax=Cladophialophora bantiana (strain ATCC 10958 / CBS 173.52 / CDC B-1940 / NIH 8579) TaxID=1442370 RepID=A0A0D2F0M7_CLAB1|nr:uncharacterized protein Z519_02850 [Cladophialophora bantiana CBS 173.52]KIW95786.1 hypothetical protein Z519_02850 [Cladophialophora bantiana CBS 173.52]
MTIEVAAVVAYPPQGTPNWRYEPVKLRTVKDHEIQIRMVSTGICHSDIYESNIPDRTAGIPYPWIFGHEGAGYVEAIGDGVTHVNIGDPVLLSYDYCHHCDICRSGQPAYCLEWRSRNRAGENGVFETKDGRDAGGKFFGQSSFASTSLVQKTSVINVKNLVHSDEELKLLAPLGCGLMTGVGAVLNSAKVQPYDIVMVTGIGAVGLGAIAAAKVLGCKEIVAVDRVAARLDVAKEFGATKVLNTCSPATSLVEDVRKLVNNQRISFVIETTGAPGVIVSALRAMGWHSKLIQIGIPPSGAELNIDFQEFFAANKVIQCHCLGDEAPKTLIPKMLAWWRDGKLPVEKIVKFYPAKDALKAAHEMESGKAIKPVLIW